MILINHVATDNEKKAGAVVTRPEPVPKKEEAPVKAEKKTRAKGSAKKAED